MEQKTLEARIDLVIENSKSIKSVGEFKKSLKDLKSLALEAGDTGSASFKKINKAIGETLDKQADLNAAFKSMSGEPIENVAKSVNGLKDSLLSLDFESASVMFSNLQTSAGKLASDLTGNVGKSIDGLANKLTSLKLSDVKDKFTSLGKSMKDFGKNSIESLKNGIGGLKEAFSGADKGTKMLSMGMKGLAGAIAATGIGLLVTLVITLITHFDDLAASGGLVGKVFTKIGDIVKSLTQGFKDFTDWLGLTDNKTQDLAKNTVKAKEKERDAIENRYDFEIEKAKAAGQETFDLEIKKTNAIKENVIAQMKAMNALRKSQGTLTEDQQKQYEELSQSLLNYNQKLEILSIEKDRKKKDDEKKLKDEAKKKKEEYNKKFKEQKARNLKEREEQQKHLKELGDQAMEAERTLRKFQIDQQQDSLNKRLELFDLESEKEEEALRKAGAKDIEITTWRNNKVKEITTQFNTEMSDKEKAKQEEDRNKYIESETVKLSIQKDSLAKRLETFDLENADKIQKLRDAGVTEVEIEQWIADEKARIRGEYVADEDQKRQDSLQKEYESAGEKLQLAQSLMSAISSLGDLMLSMDKDRNSKSLADRNKAAKKAFDTQKALGIVSAGISTALAVVNALASSPPPMNYAMAAAAGIAGAVQIGVVAAKKFTPESASSSSSSATPPIPKMSLGNIGGAADQASKFNAPQFHTLGKGEVAPPGSQVNSKVYVVESDIRNTQNRVDVINSRSTLQHP